MIGSHGDTMIPVVSQTKVKGKPLTEVLSGDKIAAIVQRTKNRGAEIVGLLKSGSAYYAPSASAFHMVKAVINDTREVMCVSCPLEGEYGLRDICVGVPARIGRNGLEKVIEIPLAAAEEAGFKESAQAIRTTIGKI